MNGGYGISRRLVLWIVIWFLILGGVYAAFGYWATDSLHRRVQAAQQAVQDQTVLKGVEDALVYVSDMFWPVMGGGLVVIGFLMWLTLRASLRQVMRTQAVPPPFSAPEKSEDRTGPAGPTREEKEARLRADQQRSLHLLSLLQREGRLVDFLKEDLQAHDDAQIGAAVRRIQETCREALNRYVSPEAIMDKDEGEAVTVEAGFDASAIKLTGNVAGAPPFKGILQHRGWRAAKVDLPTLSGSRDPAIIAPAEVEIE